MNCDDSTVDLPRSLPELGVHVAPSILLTRIHIWGSFAVHCLPSAILTDGQFIMLILQRFSRKIFLAVVAAIPGRFGGETCGRFFSESRTSCRLHALFEFGSVRVARFNLDMSLVPLTDRV